MIDFTPEMQLACDCKNPKLERYITKAIITKSWQAKDEPVEGLICSNCKSTITQPEVEDKLKALEKVDQNKD